MTTIDTTALRALAEAATPGPWEAEYDPDEGGVTVSAGSARTIGGKPAWSYVSTDRILEWDDVWPEEGGEQREADAAHIAAFHPGTALALLAEVEALRAQVERVREALFASDDGTEYEHDRDHGQAEGYPDCPGCWVETIRRALDGEVAA